VVKNFSTDLVETMNGLILAGGESSRMGSDKAMLSYFGRPQLEHLHDLLSPYCKKIFTSVKRNSQTSSAINPLVDQFDLNSPLNGILTAFATNPESAWLTLPVDMPYIDSEAIAFLLANRDPTKVATCFYDSDGDKPEPLFAIWEPIACHLLQKYLLENGKSVRGFLMSHEVMLVKARDPKVHININNPDDYDLFKKSSGHSS
jgi:molybdopterin-guanine dinucleotide biosynthesis protein A